MDLRATSICGLFLCILLAGVKDFVIARSDRSPLVLDLKRGLAPAASDPRTKRQAAGSTIFESIDNEDYYYFAEVLVGTPGTKILLQIVTDASDTWVNAPNSSLCLTSSNPCTDHGLYTPSNSSSSTYKYLEPGFSNYYGDGSSVSGIWVTDDITIGSVKITDQQFGVGYNVSSSLTYGLLGLGYIGIETYIGEKTYANLPRQMQNQNLIECEAYSLWLNTKNSNQGQLIFGGVDTDKFIGSLVTLSAQSDSVSAYQYATIDLAQISMKFGGKTTVVSSTPVQVSPDVGTSYLALHSNITDAIFEFLGVNYDPSTDTNGATVPCSWMTNTTAIEFLFQQTTIPVPLGELIANFSNTCYLAIQPTNDNNILGVFFLRSVYIVYDFTHNQPSLAPTNFNSTTSNVKTIGANGVLGSNFKGTSPSSPTSSKPSSTSSGPSSTSSSASPAPTNGGLSTGAKIGIGVGAPLGVIALAIIGFLLFQRRRKQRQSNLEVAQVSQVAPMSPSAKTAQYSNTRATSELDTDQRYAPMSPSAVGSDSTEVGHYSPQEGPYLAPDLSHRLAGPHELSSYPREFRVDT